MDSYPKYGNSMGITYAEIELINSGDLALAARGYLPEDQVRRLKVSARVERGVTMLSIPRSLYDRLGLRTVGEGDAELADGSIVQFDVTSPIEVRFQNRRTTVEALVGPQETDVLLGMIPMEGMDVLIDPRQQRLFPNPKSPDRARLLLK